MLQIFLDKKNRVTISSGNESIVKYIPTRDQRSFINKLFDENKLMFRDEDGNEHKFPVVIHDNVRKITVKLNCDGARYKDIYAGIPNGVHYRPNKLTTFEREKNEWLLIRIKRIFKSYDSDNMTQREFRTEMRTLLSR